MVAMVIRRRLILDCETTSLQPAFTPWPRGKRPDPREHPVAGDGVIWEIATLDPDTSETHLWRMCPELGRADQKALEVGQFYQRTNKMQYRDLREHDLAGRQLSRPQAWTAPTTLAPVLAKHLLGATVICAVPTFDIAYLTAFLRAYDQAPTWHHRARDIGSMAYGYLSACLTLGVPLRDAAMGVPDSDASTDDFAKALGVDASMFPRHSALGDTLLASAMLAVIEGRRTIPCPVMPV